MANVKTLTAKAREFFYADNFLDLEDVMTALREKSPAAADRLRDEFADILVEQDLMDDIMGDTHGY